MDGSKSRKSDAAATRKRRSSILKSQRSVRAPLSELEFNVATPPDQAKSRRVSFSRRTGVAEFEINEATTAWKNVYEEHNKSLESSANESAMKPAPRVSHLGARDSYFSDEEAVEIDTSAQGAALELATSHHTTQLFRLDADPGRCELTDNLHVDFSAVAPLVDDLDQLQQDLVRKPCTAKISEYSIEVDFNSTHFTLNVDDDDNMSITDTIRSPTVAATAPAPVDWTADKENIAVNPYIAPPITDNFAVSECDDILVFDGKKCKFQSNLDLSDDKVEDAKCTNQSTVLCDADMFVTGALEARILQSGEASERHRTVLFDNDGDITLTQAMPTNIINFNNEYQPELKQRTMYDMADMSVTQAVPESIQDSKRRTIVFGDDGQLSVTEGVLSGAILTEQRDRVPENKPENTERGKTIVYENDDAEISVTGVVITDIHEAKASSPRDRRKTIVYGSDNGNISMTGIVPVKIIEDTNSGPQNGDRRRTIVYGKDDGDISMTRGIAGSIFDQAKVTLPPNVHTKSMVYENDDADVSMTEALPAYIQDGTNVTKQNIDRKRNLLSMIYGNDDGNVSMANVIPANITKVTQSPKAVRRRTIVYGKDENNVSMTGVLPPNILDGTQFTQLNPERRKTIVYENDNGNLSMTGMVPANIHQDMSKVNQTISDRRKTVVYGNYDGNLSLTGMVPANIHQDMSKDNQTLGDRRKTVVYEKDDGNLSMTGVVPANILEKTNISHTPSIERRRTIVYGNDDGNLSITGVIPANIHDQSKVNQSTTQDRSIGNQSAMHDRSKINESTTERRKSVDLRKDDGNVSITGTVPTNIVQFVHEGAVTQPLNETRKSLPNESHVNLSTGDVPINVDANVTQPPSIDCRSLVNEDVCMTVTVPAQILSKSLQEVMISGTPSGINDTEQVPQTDPALVHGDKDESMIEATLKPPLIESDEDGDISMSEMSAHQSLDNIDKNSTFNKSLANNLLVYGAATNERTLEHKSELQPNINDDSVSPSIEISLHSPDASDRSVPISPDGSFEARKLPDTRSIEKAKHNASVDQAIAQNASIMGTENSRNASVIGQVKFQDASVVEQLKAQNSSVVQEKTQNASVVGRSHRASVLDALLDMSQASVDDVEPLSKPQDTTTPNEPAGNTSLIYAPTSQSANMSRDDDEANNHTGAEILALETLQPLPLEYKKQKHGIVCKIQHRLTELKNLLHFKDKSSKSPTRNMKALTISENNVQEEEDSSKIADDSLEPDDKENQPNDIDLMLKQSPELEKTAESEPESENLAELHRSLMIDLASRIHDKDPSESEKDHTLNINMSAVEHEREEKDVSQSTDAQCPIDDTRAILDALSDFTDTRRSGDFDKPTSPDKTRRSSAPDRKSMVISREDLLREISMAQALMKTEMQQTEAEVTEDSSDEHEASPPRLSGEVVKTLRFDDDESILEPRVLQKPSAIESPQRRISSVIPDFDVSDRVKELVHDLIKPMADVTPQCLTDFTRREPTRGSQVDNLESSQIDLIPSRPVLIEPRSCLRRSPEPIQPEIMHVDHSPRKPPSTEPAVIEFDHYNPLNNILLPPIGQSVVHKYDPRRSEQSVAPSLDSQCIQTETESRSVDCGMLLVAPTVDRAVAIDRSVRDREANTSIVMKGNRELLAVSSSLTLVDDTLGRGGFELGVGRGRSPVRVIFKLDEPLSSVQLDSDLTSSSTHQRQKRNHVPGRGAEVTPKPAIKVQRCSSTAAGRRRSRTPSVSPSPPASPATSRSSSTVHTVAALWSCARSTASSGAERVDWKPELLHEPSSKNLASEQDPGVNVVARIDVLPFMGTSECEWESRATDTWSFRLLRARLRLVVRLEHRACNAARARVRADTPVRAVLVQHARVDSEHDDPVAALCLCLAAEALQRIAERGVPRAGCVPGLLRRGAALARVALRWARAMRAARALLAFTLTPSGLLSLKVANIPLRSVWEVTLRVSLVDAGCGAPYPRAEVPAAARVVAAWAPPPRHLARLAAHVPEDWGHVPRTVWKLFKYLKNLRPEDDLLTV